MKELREFLEKTYGIARSPSATPRSYSAPSSPAISRPPLLLRDNSSILQQQVVVSRPGQNMWRAIFRGRYRLDGNTEQGEFWSILHGVLVAILDFLWVSSQDLWLILRFQAHILWVLLRWPLLGIFAGLFCLQLLAVSYTVTSSTFLSSFCRKDLPIVRDWVCSAWDESVSDNSSSAGFDTLNQPFEAILQSRERTISYELPFYISQYESKIRSYRNALPESEYTSADQTFFRQAFDNIIDDYNEAIPAAQIFHAHMVGTINTHITDTTYVVDQLESEGSLSPQLADGLLGHNNSMVEPSLDGLSARGDRTFPRKLDPEGE